MNKCKDNKKPINYILIGSDGDVLFELELNNATILGYTATRFKEDIKYPYLGEARSLNLNDFPNDAGVLITIDDIDLRRYCFEKFKGRLITYISPRSLISKSATIGYGSLIQMNTVISSNCHIGDCCKINIGAQIHHGTDIGNFSVISPSATCLGNSKIGEGAYIGTSTTLLGNKNYPPNIHIPPGTTS